MRAIDVNAGNIL